jgi:plastocyanin
MKKLILSVALSALCAGAFAAEHEIKMLTNGKDGMMVFEPAFLKVAKGDKVKFIKGDMSHNSTALLVPVGAAA